MGWWVDVVNANTREPLVCAPHAEGGDIAIGGEPHMTMSVTYNYSGHYYRHLCSIAGLRCLNQQVVSPRLIAILERAAEALGTEASADYWEVTPGNSGHVLSILVNWCQQALKDGIPAQIEVR